MEDMETAAVIKIENNILTTINEQCRPASWKDGLEFPRPGSVVQSIFLMAVNGGRNKRPYLLNPLIISQVHRGRIEKTVKKGKSLRKDFILGQAKLTKITSEKYYSPNFVINTTPNSGADIGIIEDRFYWRLSGKKSKSLGFFDLEPSGIRVHPKLRRKSSGGKPNGDLIPKLKSNLDPNTAIPKLHPTKTDFRVLYSIRMQNLGKFAEDFDGFYPTLGPPDDKELLNLWHPALFLIPKEGNGLKIFNMDSGELQYELAKLPGREFGNVICHENKTFSLNCKKSSLGKEILGEILIGDYPPLSLYSHIQILNSSLKGKRGKPLDLTIDDDFFIVQYNTNQLELYDLESLLEKSKLKSSINGITHQVTELPTPLISFSTEPQDLINSNGRFLVVRTSQGWQIQEITYNGLLPVQFYDGSINIFPRDAKVAFFKTASCDIFVRQGFVVTIYRVCRKDAYRGRPAYLNLIFECNYENEFAEEKSSERETNSTRRGLRNVPKKSYIFDSDIEILYDENSSLNQLAIARFSEKSVSFYIYDMATYVEVFKFKEKLFRPKASEIHDSLELDFTNYFLAVQRHGNSDTSLYIVNLVSEDIVKGSG